MATVNTLARSNSSKKSTANILFRLRDTGVNVYYRSNLKVDINVWDKKKGTINSQVRIVNNMDRVSFVKKMEEIKLTILDVYSKKDKRDVVTNEWLKERVDKILKEPKEVIESPIIRNFFDWYDEFIRMNKFSQVRKNNLLVVKRHLQQFEKYQQMKNKKYELDLHTISVEDIFQIEEFLRDEHLYFVKYPFLYPTPKDSRKVRKPVPRGGNTIVDILTKIRTFIKWVGKFDSGVKDPFVNYKIGSEIYGTPIFLTIEERNILFKFDFSSYPHLELIRDIFVFQCVVGCRVSDLYKMKNRCLTEGFIEYIQGKTKEGNPKTIRVPLNDIGMKIYDKYLNYGCESLFPFPSQQDYNRGIKQALRNAGINRIVTTINQTTRQEEKIPICDIVSSHMARRTFMGNTYKRIKDKTMVASLTGHSPNSRAFNRYVDVDDEMKREMVRLIE